MFMRPQKICLKKYRENRIWHTLFADCPAKKLDLMQLTSALKRTGNVLFKHQLRPHNCNQQQPKFKGIDDFEGEEKIEQIINSAIP